MAPTVHAQAELPETVEDETCLDCHEDIDKTLAGTPHRLASQIQKPATAVACGDCHSGAVDHVDDPSVENITNPANLEGFAAVKACSGCHVAHVDLDNYGFDTHAEVEMNCNSCHRIHGDKPSLLLDTEARFCAVCHEEKATDFMGVSNHPVYQRNITCLNCHRFVKRLDHNLAYDLAGTCRECHPEQSGPFLYEHGAINAYSVEGGGCVVCHSPHGSPNDRLLKQPPQHLCDQCHLPVGHTTAHGGIFADYDCRICHSAIHGSFVNEYYIDEDLSSRIPGCAAGQPGCHDSNR
jgi:DmsE family decaheme c-type cytochrome